MNVILAYWENDKLLPWVNRKHAWAYSTVRIAERLIAAACLPSDEKMIEEYKHVQETLPDKGKWSVLLPLKKSKSGIWLAQAWTKSNKYQPARLLTWQYDADAGLRLFEENIDKEGDSE